VLYFILIAIAAFGLRKYWVPWPTKFFFRFCPFPQLALTHPSASWQHRLLL